MRPKKETSFLPGDLIKIVLEFGPPPRSYSFPVHPYPEVGVCGQYHYVKSGKIGMYIKHVHISPVPGAIGYHDEYSEFLNHHEVVLVDDALIAISKSLLKKIK